jgi:hypothetical protein
VPHKVLYALLQTTSVDLSTTTNLRNSSAPHR